MGRPRNGRRGAPRQGVHLTSKGAQYVDPEEIVKDAEVQRTFAAMAKLGKKTVKK